MGVKPYRESEWRDGKKCFLSHSLSLLFLLWHCHLKILLCQWCKITPGSYMNHWVQFIHETYREPIIFYQEKSLVSHFEQMSHQSPKQTESLLISHQCALVIWWKCYLKSTVTQCLMVNGLFTVLVRQSTVVNVGI